MKTFFRRLPVLLVATLLHAQAVHAPTITAVQVAPPDTTLPVGSSKQFTAVATWSDGTKTVMSPLVPAALTIMVQPTTAKAKGAPPVNPVVQVVNAQGMAIAAESLTVSVRSTRIASGLTGVVRATTNAQGRAVFNGLLFGRSGSVQMVFSVLGYPGIKPATSQPVVVSP